MTFKRLIWFIGIIASLWLIAGVYIAGFTEHMSHLSDSEIILKSPIYAFELIKNWVVSI